MTPPSTSRAAAVRNPDARRDALVVLAALGALVAWEASGLDLVLAALWGDAGGFALREHWFFRRVLHDGGRWLSGLALAACVVWAWRGDARVMARRLRFAWLGVVVLCFVAVPGLKRISRTSCPWSLEPFGGDTPYVPHWLLGVFDGGPGYCFPSGHAVAAFAFLPLYFQWRRAQPQRARWLLAATLFFGTLFGWAQLVRGAHFPSHTLWSAWLCGAIGALAARALQLSETAADGELQLHLDSRAGAG
jgi:membrane-associated PAP2 superfamily phosphatase